MAGKYEGVIPWRLLQQYLTRELAKCDHKGRRLNGDGLLTNQGRAQQLEELLNLPAALEDFADDLEEDSKSKVQKVQA